MIVIAFRIYHEPLVAIGFLVSLALTIAAIATTGITHLSEAQIVGCLAPLATALTARPLVTPANTTAPPTDEVDLQTVPKDGK